MNVGTRGRSEGGRERSVVSWMRKEGRWERNGQKEEKRKAKRLREKCPHVDLRVLKISVATCLITPCSPYSGAWLAG